jgi:imidazolonepropionase-like amidohydrolase
MDTINAKGTLHRKSRSLIAMLGVTTILGLAIPANGQPAASVPQKVEILPPPAQPGPLVQRFVTMPQGKTALQHIRVIDGTGKPSLVDRTVLIDGDKIVAILPGKAVIPAGYKVVDMTGHTAFPGIVGMHNHLFYVAVPNRSATNPGEPPVLVPQMTFTSPRLYLAGGVTTIRTAGSVEPFADLNLKRAIDRGSLPGPHIDVTGPYLEGNKVFFLQMERLTGPDAARASVNYWADRGVTSFKAYMNISRAELAAATEAAHARGLKITGHLCSVTYPEAAEIGIDNLEHGFFANTQLDPGKTPDTCPPTFGNPTQTAIKPGTPEAAALIKLLVDRKVALTSTLPVFESERADRPRLSDAAIAMLTPQAKDAYLAARVADLATPPAEAAARAAIYANNTAMERAFVAAGGLLIAGPDPTGDGGVVPGFSDQRGIELLVAAGFTPEQAIQIATSNGAKYLGLADRIGTIAPGMNADLVVVKGNPSVTISDVRNVVMVFKDGTGFNPQKLLETVRGRYGEY